MKQKRAYRRLGLVGFDLTTTEGRTAYHKAWRELSSEKLEETRNTKHYKAYQANYAKTHRAQIYENRKQRSKQS